MYNVQYRYGGWRLAYIPKVCVDRLLLYLLEAAAQVVYGHPGEVLSSSQTT